jgi:hypothetical protein
LFLFAGQTSGHAGEHPYNRVRDSKRESRHKTTRSRWLRISADANR